MTSSLLGWSCRVRYSFFHLLQLSMEHHVRNRIDAPPRSEACFWASIGIRSSHLQREPAMTGIWTQVLAVASPGLYWTITSLCWENKQVSFILQFRDVLFKNEDILHWKIALSLLQHCTWSERNWLMLFHYYSSYSLILPVKDRTW